jgi:hypothetical protein
MVRRSLIAAALFAVVASPLTAQSGLPGPVDWTWSADRPDANAPLGVFGARVLGMGEMEIGYRFTQMNSRGVYFGTDSLTLAETLGPFGYNDSPTTLSDIRHQVNFARGISEKLTLVARGEFAVLERETAANGSLIRTGAEEIGDIEVGILYNVYSAGAYRLHLQGGAIIPTGTVRTYADTTMAGGAAPVTQPYDMRPGGGTFGAVAAMTAGVQNERASLGAQFRIRSNFGTNGSDYTLGDRYEANGWAAYMINEAFSVSGGLRWQNWGNIEGADPTLNPTGDPMNLGAILAGQRALMPLGVNFTLPEGSGLAGHRLSLEAVYSIHHDYEGPQLGLDWGLNFGWAIGF